MKSNKVLHFIVQFTKIKKLSNNKFREKYIKAYYTNDLRLKIRFTKILSAKFILGLGTYQYLNNFGNDKNIMIDVSNPNILGIRSKGNNPVKITIKSR